MTEEPSSTHETDVIVVGGGPVGENAAARVVQGGLECVLVEAELLGGECSYWACMPSKALLRPGHAQAAARRLPGLAGAVAGPLDAAAVLERRDGFTSHWKDDSQLEWARDAGITVVRGRGRLSGPRQVSVTGGDGANTWTARHAVVVCTGSVPVRPPLPGLDDVEVWGSREGTAAHEVPRSLVVIGGGVVAVELAQAWARLGTRPVTVVSRGRLLERMEPFAGDLVADGLRADGVDVRLDVEVSSIARDDGDGQSGVRVTLDDGSEVSAQHLLLSTGRRPGTDDLGLDVVGLEPGEALETDDSGRVTALEGGWLYAAGDVTGRAPLTHQGKYQARIVADVVAARARGEQVDTTPWSKHTSTADHHAVPQVIFTDPEVASVGLTAQQGRDAGIDVRVVELDIAVAGSALHADGYTGKACLVVDESRRVVVGATFVGPDVAELLHAATIAVAGEVPLDRLWHAVPAFPTISEVWLRLLESYGL